MNARLGAAILAVALLLAACSGGGDHSAPTTTSSKAAIAETEATRMALAQLTIFSPGSTKSVPAYVPPIDVRVTDPQSGSARTVPFPIAGAQLNYPYLVRGSHLVVLIQTTTPQGIHIDTAYLVSSTLRQWRRIGAASSAVPARDSQRVWLVTHPPELKPLHRTIREVRLDGAPETPAYPLPDGRTPIVGVDGGLLTRRLGPSRRASAVYEVWNPATNRVIRQLAVGSDPAAFSSTAIASTEAECLPLNRCALSIIDIRTGTRRRVLPPPGMVWSSDTDARFSPDGRRLAMIAGPPPTPADRASTGIGVAPGSVSATVVLIDVTTGQTTRRSVTTWKGAASPSWSSDGTLLFFVRDQTHLGYFNVAYPNGPKRGVALPWADSYMIAPKQAMTPTTTTAAP